VLGLVVIVMAANLIYRAFSEDTVDTSDNGDTVNTDDGLVVNNSNSANSSEQGVGGADTVSSDEEINTNQANVDVLVDEDVPAINVDDSASTDDSSAPFNAGSITNAPYTVTNTSDTEVYDYGSGNAISVMPATSESIVRNSLAATEEFPFTVNGIEGREIAGTSLKDGSIINYLLITNGDTLFFVRGSDTFLTEVKIGFSLP